MRVGGDKHATRIVDVMFGEIIDALSRGDHVEIRGFGSFSTVVHDARAGRNPRTGEAPSEGFFVEPR